MNHSGRIKLRNITGKAEADIDIIAIHGIDTDKHSDTTWAWRSDDGDHSVDWLSDQSMLPSCVGKANIWKCDWHVDLLLLHELEPRSLEDIARDLLATLEHHFPHLTDTTSAPRRPIFFIASCFGGVLLMKTLSEWSRTRSNLLDISSFCGAIFIATPFQSTSLKRITQWAKPFLASWAKSENRELGPLLKIFEDTTIETDKLVQDFRMFVTAHWHHRALGFQLFTFYDPLLGGMKPTEKELPIRFNSGEKSQIVEKAHAIMSKFPSCEDGTYGLVRQKVEELLRHIRSRSSLLSKADQEILSQYETKVKIERLSRNLGSWSIEQCSFNLCEMEGVDECEYDAKYHQELPSVERSTTENVAKRPQIELQQLFEDRHDEIGNISKPRRIFVCGQPGIGKTTLCKKAVYEHISHQLWKPLFDRLLWIPLRNLMVHSDFCSLPDLFRNEFFSQCPEQEHCVEALVNECEEKGAQRTLFILDGVDEIWYGLPCDNVKRGLVLKLLNMPNVIVTSRSTAALLLEAEPFDLRLEVHELDAEQNITYIEAVGRSNQEAIKLCLTSNPALQELCRTPIQLDTLCAGGTEILHQPIQTTTDLYKAACQHMESTNTEEQTPSIRQTLSFLEEMALEQLVGTVALSDFEVPADMHAAIRRVPFVQPSNAMREEPSNAVFHFIHLNFHAYFSARRIVHLWTHETENARFYLRKYKYTARFAMVWRFVAGLLRGQKNVSQFFEEINTAPLDLLGPAHQRLLMQCLEDLPSPVDFQKSIEETLTGWMFDHGNLRLVEWNELPVSYLLDIATMRPFERFWQRRQRHAFSENARRGALQALGARPGLSENASALEKIATLLTDRDVDVRKEAGDALKRIGNLPASILDIIVKHLGKSNVDVGKTAVHALKGTTIPEDNPTITAIEKWLTNGRALARLAALDAVRCWPDVPIRILHAIISCLNDSRFIAVNIRWAAVYVVNSMPKIPKHDLVYDAVISRLGDKTDHVRWAAIHTLKGMCIDDWPESALSKIRDHLKSKKGKVKRAAIDSLQRQTKLPRSVVDAIAESLDDDDDVFRRAAVQALKDQVTLSPSTIRKISTLLETETSPSTLGEHILRLFSKEKSCVKRATALDALRDRRDFEAPIIQKLVEYLDDNDCDIRSLAVYALKSQPDVHIPVDAIVRCIKHDNANIARAAADVIRGKPDLSQRVLDSIPLSRPENGREETITSILDTLEQLKYIPRLSHSTIDWVIATGQKMPDIRKTAAQTLRGQPSLSESVLKVLTSEWLGDDDKLVRCAVVEVLKDISDLPEPAISAVVEWTQSENASVRSTALCVLAGRSRLPSFAVDAMVECLGSEDENLRRTALYALKGRQNLPRSAHMQFIGWLRSEDAEYRIVALEGLKGGPPLPPGTREAIIDCLSHNQMRVRRAAADALQDQPDHLEAAPETVSEWLSINKDANFRRAAIYALEGQPNLSDHILDAIADCIGSNDPLLRESASKALRGRASLPKSTVLRITNWMPKIHMFGKEYFQRRKDKAVTGKVNILEARTSALEVLQDRPGLPEASLNAMAECLGDKDVDLRWSAVYALKGRPSLPDSTFELITRCLREACAIDVRWAALDVLKDTPDLSRLAVNMIANCLHYTDKYQKKAALDILVGQAELSPSAVSALLKCDELDTRSVLRLMRHKVVRQSLLYDRPKPFMDALAQAAREYHLSWTIDGGESVVEMEEGSWGPAQSG